MVLLPMDLSCLSSRFILRSAIDLSLSVYLAVHIPTPSLLASSDSSVCDSFYVDCHCPLTPSQPSLPRVIRCRTPYV